MSRTDQHISTDVAVAWCVAIGVGAAGIYDFLQGKAPQGAINLNADAALVLFIAASATTIALASKITAIESSNRNIFRRLLLFVSVVPALIADPTYSCLLIAIPLMDVRRRDNKQVRTVLTIAILGIVAILLVTEDTPRVTAEIEAMIGVGIAFVIITMLGDTFRQLDQTLVTHMELAQLNERIHMADELHDSVGHHLLAASVQLQKATTLRAQDPLSSDKSVALAQQAISEAIADTRLIVGATRNNQPSFNFEASIHDLIRRVSEDTLSVTADIEGNLDTLDQPKQLALYRVAQEALSNIVRHSAATQANINCVSKGSETTLTIADNGCGFKLGDINKTGGLLNMKRRIDSLDGTLSINSENNRTSIIAMVPQ